MDEARRLHGAHVTREDVFYATYALLHHPQYRLKYAENLKRELPRLPLDWFAGELAEYARIGRALGDLHVGYESAKPFPFAVVETKIEGRTFSSRVQKMKFNAERTELKVNEFLTLSGFAPAMFAYKLGNRSALDWVVESYRVKEDARSGLVSDPNRPGEPKFILNLIGKIAGVSLETQRLVGELAGLFTTDEP